MPPSTLCLTSLGLVIWSIVLGCASGSAGASGTWALSFGLGFLAAVEASSALNKARLRVFKGSGEEWRKPLRMVGSLERVAGGIGVVVVLGWRWCWRLLVGRCWMWSVMMRR
ncbi:hypothetical protein BDZ94DRAFT_1242361 [Collybia nuda]|uniref:Uncharacterized protein n=1 Tax=Collybia nuda TaxID=64659 RepID=A0A9P6CBQ4_9AGAR|nr:hypothetical protein BDZ94DRAFT_1242361 [Collybia nuda]